MKKILVLLAAVLMSIGALAADPVNPMAVAVGPSYYSIANYVTSSGYNVDLQASTGLTLNFSYPLSKHFSAYPSFSANWNKISDPLATKADATYLVFDLDAKYTFNPGQTTEFYVMGGPTWINSHFSNEGNGFTTNKLTFNVGAGLQFPLFYKNLKLLVEGSNS